MRRGLSLAAGALWFAVGAAGFADDADTKDRAPWHVQVVAKLDHAQPNLSSAKAASDQLKYLHLHLKFRPDLGERKLHEFRVTDKDGRTVADVHGFYRDHSLLVFEGDWKSLEGLYLDGLGRREPLFPSAPARPAKALDLPARSTSPVADCPEPDRVVRPTPQRVVMESPGTRRVVVDSPAAPQRVVVSPGRDTREVIVERQGPAVVADGPSVRAPVRKGTGTVAEGQSRTGARNVPRVTAGDAQSPWDIDPPLDVPPRGDRTRASARHASDTRAGEPDGANGKGADSGKDAATSKNSGSGTGKGTGSGAATGEDSGAGSGSGSGSGGGAGAGGAGAGRAGSSSGRGTAARGARPSLNGRAGIGVSRGTDAGAGNRATAGEDAGVSSVAARGSVGLAGAGTVGGAGGGGGSGGMGGGSALIHIRSEQSDPSLKSLPMILYLSCTDEWGRGRIYQVDERGIILGLVTLPYAATGLALHGQQPALVAAVPREHGKIFHIDRTGRVSVLLEDNPLVPQPVDVGIAANSDAVVVADNLAHVLAGTSIAGEKARELRRFDLKKWDRPAMSVAVTLDNHVLLATALEPGVYRFPAGNFSPRPPILPNLGGVAADTTSLRWAAAQPPSQIAIFDGDSLVKTLRLPLDRSLYRHGLLSFAREGRVVVAAEPAGKPDSGVWLLELATKDDSARELFLWRKEPILDFVVGPRMPWEPYEPDKRRSVY